MKRTNERKSNMLALLFSVGSVRYALAASGIVEVMPLVALKPVPALPPEVAGLLNYRGSVVPVIDLGSLIERKPCPALFSSRIVLTHYPLLDGRRRTLGLCVERASETLRFDVDRLVSSELRTTPWLGKLMIRDGEMVQLINPQALLTEELRALLFPPENDDQEAVAVGHADPASD